MGILKKSVSKKEEPIEASEPIAEDKPKQEGVCQCGEPVAAHLGQNQVCVKHIKRS